MAKKQHVLTLGSLMAIAILAVVSIGPATGQTNQLPTAEVAANQTTGSVGDWFFFDGSASVDPDGAITRFEWDFGDGTSPVGGPSVEGWDGVYRTFDADGTYTVTLTVTDDGGAVNNPADPKSTIVITIGTGTTTTTAPPTTTTTAAPSGTDGAALFTTSCSACHTQANLAGRGLSNQQIVTVMTSGIMTAQASSLNATEIQAVADYIVPAASGGTTTTTPPSATTTTTAAPAGASASSLFTTSCAACHTKANITDRGLTSAQIASALTSGIMKAQAASLSSSQIQAVASYLAAGSSTGETTTTTAAPAGASGSSLFTTSCAACHTKANLAGRGLSSQQIVTVMTSGIMTAQASILSSTQIQAVASYITAGSSDATTGTEATDGGDATGATITASPEAAGLYDANCAACHGATGEGGVGPSLIDADHDFEETIDAIANGLGTMPGFSGGLSEDQIRDLAAYSVAFQGGTPTTAGELPTGEGADVYAASCAACHGAKGEGASAMPINVPFDNEQLMEIIRVGIGDMPGFATTLSDPQITSLAEYVHALAALSAPPTTEAPPSEDYIIAIQPSRYIEFDTERSSVPLDPTARLAFALGTLAVLAGLAFWEIQRTRKGPEVSGGEGTSPSGTS